MSYAALAGNPLLISPDKLIDEGWLSEEDFAHLPEFPPHTVDYDRVYETKIPLLKKASENFKANASELQRREFEGFCETKAYWLDDYALFMALKDAHEGASWNTWEADIAKHKPEAVEKWRSQLSDAVYYYKYSQFEFFRQWTELRRYANLRGIQIIGDIPIYVAHDSADVWAHPEAFALDEETGAPKLMAGVPPDYFSATGQLWGNPVYNWENLQQTHFQWWIERFQAMLDYVDLIRIDHFRGFQAYWVVPQGEETAMNGQWVEAPGEQLFQTLNERLGKLPVLAEDLGVITPEVEALRDQFEFPGMKVLQFAFGDDPGNPFLPFNYPRNCVVYTGTHDNDTTVGWFNQLSDYEKNKVQTYLGHFGHDGIQWDLIRIAMSSIANIAIIPVQDLLGLGTDARMNFPSKAEGNWAWRYQSGTLTGELTHRLKELTTTFGRAPISTHQE